MPSDFAVHGAESIAAPIRSQALQSRKESVAQMGYPSNLHRDGGSVGGVAFRMLETLLCFWGGSLCYARLVGQGWLVGETLSDTCERPVWGDL